MGPQEEVSVNSGCRRGPWLSAPTLQLSEFSAGTSWPLGLLLTGIKCPIFLSEISRPKYSAPLGPTSSPFWTLAFSALHILWHGQAGTLGAPACPRRLWEVRGALSGWCLPSFTAQLYLYLGVSFQNSKQQVGKNSSFFRFSYNLLWFLRSQPYTYILTLPFPTTLGPRGRR